MISVMVLLAGTWRKGKVKGGRYRWWVGMDTIDCVNASTSWSNPHSQWSWKIKCVLTQDDGTHI